MAAVATAAEKAMDQMSKLKLDTSSKSHDAPVAKKPTGTQYRSMDGKEVPNMLNPPCERSLTPLLQEHVNMNPCFFPSEYPSTAYYYGGEWEDYSRYANPDGMEMPPHGVYGDMYHHGYGYAPYGVYPSPGSPVPTMGHDGQLYGPQHYQYPATYYQPPAPSSTPYIPNQAPTSRRKVSTSLAASQPPIHVDTAKAKTNGAVNGNANGNSGPAPAKASEPNSSSINGSYDRGVLSGGHLSSGYQDPRFGFGGIWSPVPCVDAPMFPDGQHRQSTTSAVSSTASHINNSTSARNQNLNPLPHLRGFNVSRPTSGMGLVAPGIMNRTYPNNRMYTQSGNAYRTGLGVGSNFYDSGANGRWGISVDSKYNPRGRGNGLYGYVNENLDGLSELNRGPRADRFKNQKGFGATIDTPVKGPCLSANGNIGDPSIGPDRDQFNREDFPENYLDAKFFVIKSYSEDHVHKSIKYNVWASTPNGNKKLDAAYQEAQEKTSKCPLFLLFSVNTSGQFVGVAEMLGPVDFNKTVDYWQQDKWTGCFPVKWHIVKDVPNNILKHITLENNENKSVTNSRDTQEVRLEQGLQMLKLFKEHVSKTSILDDFGFYETRQKAMQEKKSKQHQLQKQIVDGKPTNAFDGKDTDGGATGKPRVQKPTEPVTIFKKETGQVGLLERKPSEENAVAAALLVRKSSDENCAAGLLDPKPPSDVNGVAANGDASNVTETVTEKCIVANNVADGC